jgi:DNA polymerase-3 subunit alpha
MPTETEIKSEMLNAVRSKTTDTAEIERVSYEIDEFSSKEDLSSRPCIQKIYSQWKNAKKGHKNPFNSLLGYYLGITDKKPTDKFQFSKRRAFARPSPPDIDSDFDFERRPEILDYLVWLYGRGHVGNIGTYQGLKMKSALTRIIKALDIANAFHKGSQAFTTENELKAKEIKDSLPEQRGAVLKVKDENGEEHVIKSTKDAIKWCQDFKFYMDQHPEILQHANNIEGLLSIYSVHASGVVLCDVPLDQIAPLRTAKEKSGQVALATQLANEDLELSGLIKFDILAISTLTVIAETVKMIQENCGINIDIENLPLDDRKTLDLYKSGKLCGVFQCESYPMQKTCMDIGVDRFEDIMAAISLFRPGPMESIPEYCARKRGERQISYFHPSIEPHVKQVLSTTYGILVYQEQVMKLCETLGGMTKTEGLVVIKGIGKKKEDIIAKGRTSFIKGAVLKGVPKEVAEQYWDKFITPFASYGFNAAHSCCYAYISYITAYLKANFPEEYMCSYMNVETRRRKHDKVTILEKECKNVGITVLPREINKCEIDYRIIKKKDEANGIHFSEIRPSINCKGLSHAAAQNIVANRPYNSINELAEKTDSSVDIESVTALADAKFFKTSSKKLVETFEQVREDLKKRLKNGDDGTNLFE